ncbi:proton-conducting transporter membrane subunit [Terricaulis sp.]|uniref:proton-conducting transporter transmembrane domain-containing protein n=1 Tax=Terricaulis sp. TaxID=2768686 RepID=UPI003783B0E6
MSGLLDLARLHAPLLMVTAPLIGAALAALVSSARLSWVIAVIAASVSAVFALDAAARGLLTTVPLATTIEAVALHVDGVSLIGAPVVAGAALLTIVAAGALLRDFNTRAVPFAMALLLCVSAGWLGALMAADLTGVLVAAESAWLACVGLVALSAERDRAAMNGALRMLAAGGVGAALMLVAAGLIYSSVGSLSLQEFASATVSSPGVAATGAGLALVALAIKAGVAPLHFWVGAAYGRAGALAALALGALSAVGALAVFLRLAAYAIVAPAAGDGVAAALVALGGVCVLVGSLQAVGATNMRRLAAYAGAAQAGCILFTAALGSQQAFAAAFIQLFALCASALALLGGAAALGGVTHIGALDGLGRRAPLASAAITAGALSLMGAPLTIGFLGRWRLIEAGVGAGWWWATASVIAASLAAVYYGGRLIERLYFRRVETPFEGGAGVWRFATAPMLAAAIAAILYAVEPSALLNAAGRAAELLFGAPQ